MATVYSGSRYNSDGTTGWRIRVDYSETSATVYVDVVSSYSSSSIWLRFSTGNNTFTKSATTFSKANNGTATNKLGTLTIDPYTTTTIYETCSGSSWGGTVNGESSVTIPRQKTPSAPTISASVSNITSTSATYTAQMTNNPYSYWRVHIYDTGGNWKTYSTAVNTPCSFTQTGLAHNTTYNFYYQYTNSSDGEGSGLKPTSFTTSGNAPTINSVSPSPSRTTCSLANNSISYDTNASFKSVSVKYGTSTSYGSTVSSTSLSGLTPNTTYYYSMTVTDNWNRTSGAKTGSFKTTCNAPTSLSISRNTSTVNSITIKVSATGDTNAGITNYTLYYRKGTSGSYTSTSLGTSTSKTVSSLDTDTNYQFYFTATNAGGTSTSSTATYSTLLSNPTITTPVASNLTPFAVTTTVSGSISPSRTLQYRFSKDNGSTWTAYQSSNTYNWAGLTEETTYQMKVQVKATHTGTNASDTTATSSVLSVTTLTDQAKIRIKKQLPSGYTQLTYVDSSGAQYVDTGLLTESGYTFEYKLQWRDLPSSHTSWLLGSNNGTFRMYAPYVNTTGTWGDGYAGTTYSSGPNPTINTDYTVLDINEVGKQKTIINGTTIFDKTDTTDGSSDYHLLLFGQTHSGATTAVNLSSVRLYYLNIYNKGIMVRAFVPCKRNSDSKIGLYDLVEDKFYQSATSTALLAGSTTTNTGKWVKGKTYFKKNGQWVKAKKIYIKKNGNWVIGNNYDPE